MINFLKSFFAYVPPDLLPEVSEEEPPDPNTGKSLSDKYREARRNLVLLATICIAWSGAQFTTANPTLELAKVSLCFDSASIPVVLCLFLVYLCYRWVFEYSIMDRDTRRWHPAQIDFRVVSILARFAFLSVCAGALERSFWTIIILLGMLGVLTLCVVVLSFLLMLVTMPIRIWARERAGRTSVANATFEALVWATLFAILLTVVGMVALGVMSYHYQPISSILWTTPPSIVAYTAFIAVSVFVFLSHWLLRPYLSLLFAERPSYRTYRDENGRLIYQFRSNIKASHQANKSTHTTPAPL